MPTASPTPTERAEHSALLEEDGKLSGDEFWRPAAAVLQSYQGEHPELAEQFARRRANNLALPEFL